MTEAGFTLFDTVIGRCGIAWGARGVVGVQLPEAREAEMRARLLRRFPDTREARPPPDVRRALEGIIALLRGEASNLSSVTLDMERSPAFHRRVYEIARTIPPGETLSYGEIAARLGVPGAARAVGQALGRNPFAIIVPCHRVLAAGGKVGGFSANGGITTKLRLLSIEAARANCPLYEGDGVLGFDPRAAVTHLRASDAALARVIDDVGPFDLPLRKTQSIFVALAEAIVYQQLSGKAAATIFARVCALFPHRPGGPTAEQILQAPDEALRGAGLSRSKLLSLRDLAHRAVGGALPTLAQAHRMTDETIVERLTEVRGIGKWTVEMLLIFRLGRPDVLPTDDYGVRKGFAIAFKKRELPARDDVETRGERWKPYRTAASWYLWRVAERAKEAPADRGRAG
jgi:methylated-DNA-[protein]-cysteine S-methyltransferase